MPQDENRITHQFWNDVRVNLAQYQHQQDPSHNPRPHVHPNRYHSHGRSSANRGNGRNHIQRTLKIVNGYPKAFIGSGGTKRKNSNYTQIPLNSLNIMDYVKWKNYPFILNSATREDYTLGMDARTAANRHRKPNSNDLSSVHVALHPQFYYDSNGNIKKDQNGQPVQVTGRGTYTRFSEGYSSSKNPIISMMMDTENISIGQAFREYKRMTQEYGVNTRFDPLDKNMKLPYSSSGDTVTPKDQLKMDSAKNVSTQADNYYDMERSYRRAARLGQHFLKDTQIGEKPLQALHEQGFTDQMIEEKHLGWFPDNNMLSHFTKDQVQRDAGIPIKSQLYKLDRDLNFSDRFNGQYTAPLMKNNRYVGIQGFDHDMQPTQRARYAGHYAYNALGNTMNGINQDYRDTGGHFNRKDAAGLRFAQGYLHGKRAISTPTVNRLFHTGMVRVNLGKKGDPKAHERAVRDKKDFRYLKKHPKEYVQATGNQAYQKLQEKYPNAKPEAHPDRVKKQLGKEALSQKANQLNRRYSKDRYQGSEYAPCIEFPQYLDGNDKNGVKKGRRVPVGADRIYFQPGSDYERNHNFGQDGKIVARDSMHNFGYNINCGKATSPTGKRELYVFEAPIDAISYVDLHRKELSDDPNSCDILSLSGSNAKTRTISNFIYNKVGATNDHYDKIYFGTDNDVHGQGTITEYTEKARNHWQKDRVNHLFHGIVPPQVDADAKDWNDVAKYQRAHPKEDALKKGKPDYSMDEIRDKAIHDNLGHLSTDGIRHMNNINKLSKSLFVEYENHGESSHMAMSHDTISQLDREFNHMKSDNYGDAKTYHDFNRSIGESFNPYELDRSFSQDIAKHHPEMKATTQVSYDSEHNPVIQDRKAQKVSQVHTNGPAHDSGKDEVKRSSPQEGTDSAHPQGTDATSSTAQNDDSSRTAPSPDQPNGTSTKGATDKKRSGPGKTPAEAAMPDDSPRPKATQDRPERHHSMTKAGFRRKYFAQEVRIKKQKEKQHAQEVAEKKTPKDTQVKRRNHWNGPQAHNSWGRSGPTR